MTIAARMKLLCCLATLLMVAGVVFFQYNDRVVISSIKQQRIQERSNILDELLRLKSAPLNRLVADSGSSREMIAFLTSRDKTWARHNIDTALPIYGADACWVLAPNGRVLHAAVRTERAEAAARGLAGMTSRLNGSRLAPQQFYTRSGDSVLEVHAASLHGADDRGRTGTVYGYFVAARLINAAYFRDLEKLTLSSVELTTAPLPAFSYSQGQLTLSRTFRDLDGRTVVQLKLQSRLPEVETLHRHNLIHLAVGMLLVLLFIITSARVINHQVALVRAKNSLDEAQHLAGIGSWEHSLLSGQSFWSENCFRLLGLPSGRTAPGLEEFLGLVCDKDRQDIRTALQQAMVSGGTMEVEFRLAADPQRIFRSNGAVLQSEDGTPVRMVGSIREITEERRQAALREELLKHREEFVTRLSHDLKTPLTPLVALLPLIRKHAREEKVQEWASLCINSVDHMKELVVKTIKLARYSAPGQLHLKPVAIELGPAVDDYIAKRCDLAQDKQLRLDNRVPSGLQVYADPLELEEVFYNLISNAVKYSPADSLITISAETEANLVTVSISDQGIGLSADELPHIFDEFFKADSSRHELDSSGLGLSICKRIIENHGGSIRATSPGLGQGTTIRFTIAAGGTP